MQNFGYEEYSIRARARRVPLPAIWGQALEQGFAVAHDQAHGEIIVTTAKNLLSLRWRDPRLNPRFNATKLAAPYMDYGRLDDDNNLIVSRQDWPGIKNSLPVSAEFKLRGCGPYFVASYKDLDERSEPDLKSKIFCALMRSFDSIDHPSIP